MEATTQNYQIADKILTLLAKENCTVLQAEGILSFVQSRVRAQSTVQHREGELSEGSSVDSIN
ncbi:MAG: hypothetical protein NC489_39130 [Ruminococcus flavefaciens]|nr:hypothetical protein [Ruminococcus flavefaciens]